MREVKFFEWIIEIEDSIESFVDEENRRLVLMVSRNERNQEIVTAFELNEKNELLIHPRTMKSLIFKDDQTIKVGTFELD